MRAPGVDRQRLRGERGCRLELGTQTEFPEPSVRINTDLLDADQLRWNEGQAWDELVAYYASSFGGGG